MPFGPYTLCKRLASGGMAQVYLATTQGIGGFEKKVAIKLIHPQYSQDEEFVSMLVEEAKLSVQLAHPNIVQTFDLGCIDESYFIVMECVEGQDVNQIMQKLSQQGRAMPVGIAAYIFADICQGLSYAHRRSDEQGRPLNIVHRDVSPQNVLVSDSGEVKLADFGIAKASYRSESTDVGVIKGKYFYMSPEQAKGDVLDGRSDVFSAGVVLWELLTGQPLHNLADVGELLKAVRAAEICPPSEVRPEVPASLDAIVLRALAREPSRRYSSADDFADALNGFLASTRSSAGPVALSALMESISDTDDGGSSAEKDWRSKTENLGGHDFVRRSESVLSSLDDLQPPESNSSQMRWDEDSTLVDDRDALMIEQAATIGQTGGGFRRPPEVLGSLPPSKPPLVKPRSGIPWLFYAGMAGAIGLLGLSGFEYSKLLKNHSEVSRMNVTSIPTGAAVYVDGQFIGSTPISDQHLNEASSAVTLEIRSEGHASWRARLYPSARNHRIVARLDPER